MPFKNNDRLLCMMFSKFNYDVDDYNRRIRCILIFKLQEIVLYNWW